MLISDDPTDLNTRIGLLHLIARVRRYEVSGDAIEFIARCPTRDPQKLIDTLDTAVTLASSRSTPVDKAFVEGLLRRWLSGTSTMGNAEIATAVIADYYGLTIEELNRQPAPSSVAAHARLIAMYMCYQFSELTVPKIGALFGRGHQSVMYACRKTAWEVKDRPEFADQISELARRIGNRLSGDG